jgi:hypothetical protein
MAMPVTPNICQVHDKTGITYLRDGFLVTFFLPKPLHESVGGVAEVFDLFLSFIPPDAVKWAGIGAGSEEWKPVNKSTFDKCRAAMVPAAAKKRAMTAIEMVGAAQASDAAVYAFTLIGTKPDKEAPDEVDLVEMCFPANVADAGNVESLVATLASMAEKLPYLSGYASPALLYSQVGEGKAMVESRALATRYPGLDVQKNKLGCVDLDHRVRGARWITFLGPDILKKLGGREKLRTSLGDEIGIEVAGTGVMLRAGRIPEIGDRSKRIDTPLLRRLAAVLEPVTQFNEPVLLTSYFADRDEGMLRTWERRFLD